MLTLTQDRETVAIVRVLATGQRENLRAVFQQHPGECVEQRSPLSTTIRLSRIMAPRALVTGDVPAYRTYSGGTPKAKGWRRSVFGHCTQTPVEQHLPHANSLFER